jgi:hypothetical protein
MKMTTNKSMGDATTKRIHALGSILAGLTLIFGSVGTANANVIYGLTTDFGFSGYVEVASPVAAGAHFQTADYTDWAFNYAGTAGSESWSMTDGDHFLGGVDDAYVGSVASSSGRAADPDTSFIGFWGIAVGHAPATTWAFKMAKCLGINRILMGSQKNSAISMQITMRTRTRV